MPPTHQSGPPCTLHRLLPQPSLLALHVALMVCLPLDSAVGDVVQPAAESRHVQSHEHGVHVSGAAPRVPLPPTRQSGPPCTLVEMPLPRPSVCWPSMSPSQYAFLWTRQSATSFNQPLSFDTSSVTNIDYMFMVRLRACPCAHSPIGLANPLHAPRSTPRPSPRPACRPHGTPPF